MAVIGAEEIREVVFWLSLQLGNMDGKRDTNLLAG